MAIFHMSFSNISAGKGRSAMPAPLIEVVKNYLIITRRPPLFGI